MDNTDKLVARELLVKKEITRLNKLFKDIPTNKKNVVEGLIVQAARLRILLDSNWEDITINGDYELFSQGEQDPYDRKRPVADLYNNRDKAYHTVVRQLVDLLPDDKAKITVQKYAKGSLI